MESETTDARTSLAHRSDNQSTFIIHAHSATNLIWLPFALMLIGYWLSRCCDGSVVTNILIPSYTLHGMQVWLELTGSTAFQLNVPLSLKAITTKQHTATPLWCPFIPAVRFERGSKN